MHNVGSPLFAILQAVSVYEQSIITQMRPFPRFQLIVQPEIKDLSGYLISAGKLSLFFCLIEIFHAAKIFFRLFQQFIGHLRIYKSR